MTSLWQRWGRAGRAGRGWAVLVAGQDALDQYFMREPERLLSREVEDAIVDLANPHILEAHLAAAAYERPLEDGDETYFGAAGMARAAQLAASGKLRRTAGGALAWGRSHSPAAQAGLRSASAQSFVIADGRDGTVLGTVERERVFRTAHPGAVYLHLGESYLVRHLDLDAASVVVKPFGGAYYTQAKVEKHVAIAGTGETRPLSGGAVLSFGTIEVTEQVVAYQKRGIEDAEVIDTVTLDLPEQVFTTEALWFTLPPELTHSPARAPSSAPCTPPSTPASPCCPSTPCVTAGTSVACRPPGTGRPTSPPCSSTMATRGDRPDAARLRDLRPARRRRRPAHRRVPMREQAVRPVCRAPSAVT